MLIDGLLYECYFVILIVMVVMRGCVVLDGYVYIYIYIRIYIWLVVWNIFYFSICWE